MKIKHYAYLHDRYAHAVDFAWKCLFNILLIQLYLRTRVSRSMDVMAEESTRGEPETAELGGDGEEGEGTQDSNSLWMSDTRASK